MPEHREINKMGLTDLSGCGRFFIRTVAFPGALVGRWPLSSTISSWPPISTTIVTRCTSSWKVALAGTDDLGDQPNTTHTTFRGLQAGYCMHFAGFMLPFSQVCELEILVC